MSDKLTKLQNVLDDIEGLYSGRGCDHYRSFDEMRKAINELVGAHEPEARLTEMNFKAKAGEPIEAYAQFEGGAVKAFAVSLVQWFRESGGENYVTCDLRDPETGEAYSITMQKAGGRTPAQDLCELRQQLNRGAPHE